MNDHLIIPKSDAITALELLAKPWKGLTKHDIQSFTSQLMLPVYLIRSDFKNSNKRDIYVCTMITDPPRFSNIADEDLAQFLFKIEDIAHIYLQFKDTIDLKLDNSNKQHADKDTFLSSRSQILRNYKNLMKKQQIGCAKINSKQAPKTSNATRQATDNRVKAWKKIAHDFVTIAIHCERSNKRNLIRSELKRICKDLDISLPDVALEELRKALPKEFVRDKPGAPIQENSITPTTS